MTRITCKSCRRMGMSLCGRAKCAYIKRPFAPGKLDSEKKHRSSVSEFGEQLKAKQAMRVSYGMIERQFSSYVKDAMEISAKKIGANKIAPGLLLYQKLESRLDNIVYRAGFANSRAFARQMVSHGHILVNGKKVTIGSHVCKVGDTISIREGSKSAKFCTTLAERLEADKTFHTITVEPSQLKATFALLPKEVEPMFDTTKVLEYYSR